MRVINLILHIVSLLLMVPDAFFVGIAFLWGMQYLRGSEIIIVPTFVFLFFAGGFFTCLGAITSFSQYKKLTAKKYMRYELITYGFTALSFGLMIAYTLVLILNPAPKIPELSTDSSDTHVSMIDMAGFAVAVAGMVFTIVTCTAKNKIAAFKAAKVQPASPAASVVSRPKFCPQCGKPVGSTGGFCGNCGSRF